MSEQMPTYKIITVGDSDVGKTSILRRYLYNIFDSENMSTLGVNFSYKIIELENKKKIKLKLIDTAGQEKFRSIVKSYYKNADAVLFIFALNDLESFNHISDWVVSFQENNGEKVTKYLVGNKYDVEIKTVDQQLIDNFSKENNFPYKAVSASSNYNIEELFTELAEEIAKNCKSGNQQSIQLEKVEIKKGKEKKNCALCTFNDY